MKIFKHSVPIDDQFHEFELSGSVLHVACQASLDSIQFWALETDEPATTASFIVVGTGHEWPERNLMHRGSALAGPLVWHLLEDVGPYPDPFMQIGRTSY